MAVILPMMSGHAAPGAQTIAMGSGGHKLEVRSDGTLWAWGYNSKGQLGLGDLTDRAVPTQVSTETDWASVVVGGYSAQGHSLAIKDDGTLWAWGNNAHGELGLSDLANRSVPTQVGTDSDWASIAAGEYHSMAIKTDGTLWTWGYNYAGALGHGNTIDRLSPTQVGTDTDWTTVTAAYIHSLAVKADGTLWAWGYNGSSQLGLGDTATRLTPTRVGAATDWTNVWSGSEFVVGTRADGTLWTWGSNASGQLGLGDLDSRSAPTQVGTDTDWALAAPAFRHVVAVRTDGTLWAWGLNYVGNLGLGDLTDRTVPTQVGTESGWAYPAAGVNASGALKADGSTWLWGYNLNAPGLGLGPGAPQRVVDPVLLAAPPVLGSIGDKLADELSGIAFTACATDANVPADTLTYSLGAGAPAGAAIDAETGAFSWTPTEAEGPGSYSITVAVSDGMGGIDLETITVNVAEVNALPVLTTIGPKGVSELAPLSFTAAAADGDIPAQPVTFSLEAGAPAGASITSAGDFSWTPTEAQGPGSYDIAVIASDGLATTSETIAVTVDEVNTAPLLTTIGAKSVGELNQLTFSAMATDSDLPAQTLTFSLGAGAPTGASITPAGDFTWTPSEVQGPGSYEITVVVTDGTATASETITITVDEMAESVAVYRFYNKINGAHFYTASPQERDMVIATWPNVYEFEGVAYYANPANNTHALYRYYNKTNRAHFYTASPSEAESIERSLPQVFTTEGMAYAVNPAPVPESTAVYRFLNIRNGSHFYTASAEERDAVISRLGSTFLYEGPAFWVGQ